MAQLMDQHPSQLSPVQPSCHKHMLQLRVCHGKGPASGAIHKVWAVRVYKTDAPKPPVYRKPFHFELCGHVRHELGEVSLDLLAQVRVSIPVNGSDGAHRARQVLACPALHLRLVHGRVALGVVLAGFQVLAIRLAVLSALMLKLPTPTQRELPVVVTHLPLELVRVTQPLLHVAVLFRRGRVPHPIAFRFVHGLADLLVVAGFVQVPLRFGKVLDHVSHFPCLVGVHALDALRQLSIEGIHQSFHHRANALHATILHVGSSLRKLPHDEIRTGRNSQSGRSGVHDADHVIHAAASAQQHGFRHVEGIPGSGAGHDHVGAGEHCIPCGNAKLNRTGSHTCDVARERHFVNAGQSELYITHARTVTFGGATGLEVRHVKQNRLTDFQGLSSRIGYLDHLQILLQISIRKERQSPSAPPF
nr:MAG TPA: hypothetical protein [Caudoviricetes sp.]